METKARTIDNLGLSSSIRYAQDQQKLDPKLIEESRWIPQKAEVSTAKPYVPSIFEPLFYDIRMGQWALFQAPPYYYGSTRPLFSYQLIPSLRKESSDSEDGDRLTYLEDVLKKPFKRKKGKEKESEQEERERKALLQLVQCIQKLDQSLNLINARRNQYQKG